MTVSFCLPLFCKCCAKSTLWSYGEECFNVQNHPAEAKRPGESALPAFPTPGSPGRATAATGPVPAPPRKGDIAGPGQALPKRKGCGQVKLESLFPGAVARL